MPEPNSKETTVLKGAAYRLTFILSYAAAAQYGGLYVSTLELAAAQGGGTPDLIVRQRFYRPWDSEKDAGALMWETVVLPHVVTGLSIRYYGQEAKQQGASWCDAWQSSVRLPVLISDFLTNTHVIGRPCPPG
jgi:hypothetical protein